MMHLDYTLIIKETHEILMVIELDDPSHDKEKRQYSDKEKNRKLNNASIHLERVRVKEMDDTDTLNDKLKKIAELCMRKIASSTHQPTPNPVTADTPPY
jgi:hypothetical protein